MSVKISGNLPKVCAECNNWQGCFSKADYRHKNARCGWCMYNGAVEIPTPHGDLIDRNAVINRALNLGTSHDPIVAAVIEATIQVLLLAIKDIPAVINAEGKEARHE